MYHYFDLFIVFQLVFLPSYARFWLLLEFQVFLFFHSIFSPLSCISSFCYGLSSAPAFHLNTADLCGSPARFCLRSRISCISTRWFVSQRFSRLLCGRLVVCSCLCCIIFILERIRRAHVERDSKIRKRKLFFAVPRSWFGNSYPVLSYYGKCRVRETIWGFGWLTVAWKGPNWFCGDLFVPSWWLKSIVFGN